MVNFEMLIFNKFLHRKTVHILPIWGQRGGIALYPFTLFTLFGYKKGSERVG